MQQGFIPRETRAESIIKVAAESDVRAIEDFEFPFATFLANAVQFSVNRRVILNRVRFKDEKFQAISSTFGVARGHLRRSE